MKILFFILALLPSVIFANQNGDTDSLAIFKDKCLNEKNPTLRQKYCEAVQKQIKAETIANNFQSKH